MMAKQFPYTAELIEAPFRLPPWNHQIKEFEAHVESKARAKGWTMRTGKTRAAVDKACHLYRRGRIDAVLIFAPNGVHANWIEREFPIHCWPGISTSALVWRSVEAGKKGGNRLSKPDRAVWELEREAWWRKLETLKHDPALWILSINSESMTRADARKAVARLINNRRVFVIYDESDDFGTPGSQRTKMARSLTNKVAFSEIDSGTLVTGSPLAAWSQFELLQRGALGFDTFKEFKNHFAVFRVEDIRGRKIQKVCGYKNLDDLRARMARFTSVVLREDIKDMPALVPKLRRIEPSEEQLAVYRELHESFLVDIEEDRVDVGERAPRFQKMQQSLSGFVKDATGRVRWIPGVNPRLEAVSEEVFLAPGKVIIWCNFQADIDAVKKRLLVDGHGIVEYHGRVSGKAKSQALSRFRETSSREVKGLIGQWRAGGRGLDMSVASLIIGYSHTFSARFRAQAMERATKIGGGNITVLDFQAPGPDEYICKTVDGRFNVADDLAGRGMKDFLQEMEL